MDFSCYVWLKRTVHSTEEENQGIPIPLKATMISTHLLLPYLFVFIILSSQDIQTTEKYLAKDFITQQDSVVDNDSQPHTNDFGFNEKNL